jgi:hypothetical protein
MSLTRSRLDTIDLQDQLAPSAQDHSRTHLQQDGLGYHQAAELRHVQHERAAEENALSNSWTNVTGLSEEPPSEDDEIFTNDRLDDRMLHQNGNMHDEEAEHGEEDDEDDDGADRISSSPSISDGGSPRSWPRRVSSLPLRPPSLHTASEEGGDSPPSTDSSHSALSPSPAPCCSPVRSPECPELVRRSPDCNRHSVETESDCSSPFVISPEHYPLFLRSNSSLSAFGNDPLGELEFKPPINDPLDLDDLPTDEHDEEQDMLMPMVSDPASPDWCHPRGGRRVSHIETSPSVMDLNALLEETLNLQSPSVTDLSEYAHMYIDDIPEDDDDEDWETESEDDDGCLNSFSFNDVSRELTIDYGPRRLVAVLRNVANIS